KRLSISIMNHIAKNINARLFSSSTFKGSLSQIICVEGIPGLKVTGFKAFVEPVLALFRSAVRETFRHDVAARALLDRIISDCTCSSQRFIQIPFFEKVHPLCMVGPDAGIIIRLKLELHLQLIV